MVAPQRTRRNEMKDFFMVFCLSFDYVVLILFDFGSASKS